MVTRTQISRLLLYLTLAGLALMAGLIVTGITLASRYSRATVTEEVGIQAMIGLSPTYGGANTLINVTGIGFPSNAKIGLYLDGESAVQNAGPHGEAFTDGEGRFSVMFPMPAVWPDGTVITDEQLVLLAVSEDSSTHASAVFDYAPPIVQPEISLNPTTGGGGTPVTVTSVGFPAGSQVSLHLGPPEGGYSPHAYAQGIVDGTGTVTLTFAMPDNWPDGSRIKEEQLEIAVVTADGSTRASAGFDFEPIPYPLITVSPDYGGPGTQVTISGDGYRAGTIVLIKLGTSVDDAAQKTPYVETMADIRGNINVPFTMPGRWPSGLPILVRDVVVLATSADRSGYGWMGFAYLENLPPDEPVEQGTSGDDATDEFEDEVPTPQAPVQSVPQSDAAPASSVIPEVTPEMLGPADEAEPADPPEEVEPVDLPEEGESQAIILLEPAEGGPDTPVAVMGSGFPAGIELLVHLGMPEMDFGPEAYGAVSTDEAGDFNITFALPGQWPDGTPIIEEQLVIVVATQDRSILATAPFTYQPPTEIE